MKDKIKPDVLLVLPAFNEEALLKENFHKVYDYMCSLSDKYRWRILIVNDGSKDNTKTIADEISNSYPEVDAFHFFKNFGLGQVHRFVLENSSTDDDYIIFLDIDLSYDVEHIKLLLDEIIRSHAKLVLVSPYMKGGSIVNVPALRKTLSVCANQFLSRIAQGHLSTLTCMVRAYDAKFFRSIPFRSTGMEIMPEAIYKTMVLRGEISQIPGDLDWGPQLKNNGMRKSSMRILNHIRATLISGFVFRPFTLFILPGLVLLLFAIYSAYWMFSHYFQAIQKTTSDGLIALLTDSLALAFSAAPHTFIITLISFVMAVQFLSLGIISIQNKKYFEEIYSLGVAINKKL